MRTYHHAFIPINVLVGVEELATVRYPDEQCTTSAGVNEGLCNLCCSLGCGDDDILVGWKGFFDVGDADMAACEPTQQVSQPRVCEVKEEVREDSLILCCGEDGELGTSVWVSGCRRGQDVRAGDEWG